MAAPTDRTKAIREYLEMEERVRRTLRYCGPATNAFAVMPPKDSAECAAIAEKWKRSFASYAEFWDSFNSSPAPISTEAPASTGSNGKSG